MFMKYIGLSATTAELIERLRSDPAQSEDDILCAALKQLISTTEPISPSAPSVVAVPPTGCDLGKGVHLREREQMYCFRYKRSMQTGNPDGIAVAKGGSLYVEDKRVQPSKGSLVQPALQIIQAKINDVSPTNGGLTSLDAWDYWYVLRDGIFVRVGDLRPENQIARRLRTSSNKSLDELGL